MNKNRQVRGDRDTVTAPVTRGTAPDSSLLDSLRMVNGDTLLRDSSVAEIPGDSVKKSKSFLEDQVDYSSDDSIVFDVKSKRMFLHDSAQINYQTIELKANYISLDLEKKTLSSRGVRDSAGVNTGRPVFTDNGSSFTATEMDYGFESKKGLIKEAITNEGEIYLHAEVAKKDSSGVIYVKNAKFTTCIDPHPHFYIQTNKGKVVKDKVVVTGPANLRIADVPTPLVLPFGYFPVSKTKSSGIILPEYGEQRNFGFFLKNLGYYFAISDYIDLTIYGDIYTSLSFGAKAQMNYRKRYKYNGSIQAGFTQLQYGDPEVTGGTPGDDFFQTRQFSFGWKHIQDPKANPSVSFNADVNVQTGDYNRFNSNNPSGIVENIFQSNISFGKTFSGTPFNINLSVRHNQNTATGQVNVTLPEFVFNVNRFNPFKRKKQVGELRWYENIGFTYSLNFRNEINTIDSILTRNPLGELQRINSGIQHRAALTTSFKLLKHFTLTPSVNYTEKWNFRNARKIYDPVDMMIENDTVNGFFTTRELSTNLSLTTIVYGMYTFRKGKVKALRHVMTPRITASFRPDLGDHIEGYYGNNGELITYSPNQFGIYGAVAPGLSGVIGFDLNNNIEMKIASKKDTITGVKKVPIFESLSIGMNYDLARDSLNLSNLNISGFTTLFQFLRINFNMSFDPYAFRSINGVSQRVNTLQVVETGAPFRLTDARLALSFSMTGESKRKKNQSQQVTDAEQKMANDPNLAGYVDFNVPYSFSVGYNIGYQKPLDRETIVHGLNVRGDVNITPKWKVGVDLNYDIERGEFTTSSLNIYRDLHCWEMSCQVIPFGIRQSFMFTIRVKSALLQMLKLQVPGGSGYANF